MRRTVRRLWNDDRGALIATEWVFVATLLVLGIITGLVAVRQAVISELTEAAQAINALDQSFSFSGQTNCESSTAGSSGSDPLKKIAAGAVTPSQATINQSPCD
jgi:Flp pilus assembly pilin Flp